MAAKSNSSAAPSERVAIPTNFQDALAAAANGAADDWEKQFVKEQSERFEKWGNELFISPKQWAILQRVASKAPAGEDII